MGQEQSCPVDESTPPQTLVDRSIDSVAKHIKGGGAKKIVVMVSSRTSEQLCMIFLAENLSHPFDRSELV